MINVAVCIGVRMWSQTPAATNPNANPVRGSDLRRGLPRMSPALLSKRLKELHGTVDLCGVDPGYDVYLHVRSSRQLQWHDTLPPLDSLTRGAPHSIGGYALA